jgi:hypothetical protein
MDLLLVDVPYGSLKNFSTDRGYVIGLLSLGTYASREGIETGIVSGDLLDSRQTNIQATNWWKMSARTLASRQDIYMENINDDDFPLWSNFKDLLNRTKPKVVGIQYLTPMKLAVLKLAKLAKDVDPEIKIAVGGFHPTFRPEETLKNKDIDYVIRGEGEIPLTMLMKELKKDKLRPELIPGLSYRDTSGQVRNNSCPVLISDQDTLPFPERNLVLIAIIPSISSNLIRVVAVPSLFFLCGSHFWLKRVARSQKMLYELEL